MNCDARHDVFEAIGIGEHSARGTNIYLFFSHKEKRNFRSIVRLSSKFYSSIKLIVNLFKIR